MHKGEWEKNNLHVTPTCHTGHRTHHRCSSLSVPQSHPPKQLGPGEFVCFSQSRQRESLRFVASWSDGFSQSFSSTCTQPCTCVCVSGNLYVSESPPYPLLPNPTFHAHPSNICTDDDLLGLLCVHTALFSCPSHLNSWNISHLQLPEILWCPIFPFLMQYPTPNQGV